MSHDISKEIMGCVMHPKVTEHELKSHLIYLNSILDWDRLMEEAGQVEVGYDQDDEGRFYPKLCFPHFAAPEMSFTVTDRVCITAETATEIARDIYIYAFVASLIDPDRRRYDRGG